MKENTAYRDLCQIEEECKALKRMAGFVCDCGEVADRRVLIFDRSDDGVGVIAMQMNLCAQCEDDEGFSTDNNRFGQNRDIF